ncbi:MAG: hypothetical protein IJJ77_00780 [Paludibacteraceae bacterium]|nr:hypothetical protein [Paludibacteraceae bacterium]
MDNILRKLGVFLVITLLLSLILAPLCIMFFEHRGYAGIGVLIAIFISCFITYRVFKK